MKSEKKAEDFIVNASSFFRRLAEATHVSMNTLKRIAKEGNRKTIAKPVSKSTVDQLEEEIELFLYECKKHLIYNFTKIPCRRKKHCLERRIIFPQFTHQPIRIV
jgi:predicted site-specific integrase-resolvase